MKEKRQNRQPEAFAPGEHNGETVEIELELAHEEVVRAVGMSMFLEAKATEAYISGQTPVLTYGAFNADDLREEIYCMKPTVGKLTKDAFDAQRYRLHQKVKATHFACALPVKSETELCDGCHETFLTIAQANHEQFALAMLIFRDAEGHFAGFSDPIIMPFAVDTERLIERYFAQEAAEAPSGHTWNYTPGNN
jgi:hypothetical protein